MKKFEIEGVNSDEFKAIISEQLEIALDKKLHVLQPQQSDEKYLSINQVAEMFSVSRVTINNWQKNGTLKPFQIGGKVFFKMSDIEKSLTPISA